MHYKGWLRYSLASLTLVGAGLGAFLVACGDDDTNAVAAKDGGGDTGVVDYDSGSPDGSVNPADAGSQARLQIVNAATDLGPGDQSGGLRVCFGVGSSASDISLTPLPALPEESPAQGIPPGIFIGLGGNVTGGGLPLEKLALQPYLMNAESLAAKGIVKTAPGTPTTGCDKLLAPDGGAAGLVEDVDYWKLPLLPAGTLKNDHSYVLVLTGCTTDTAIANKANCGPDFAGDGGRGAGNLAVHVYEVDRTTQIPTDKVGAQFIHASPAGAAFLAGPGGGLQVVPGFQVGATNPTFEGITDGGAVPLYGQTDLAQLSGVNFASDSFTVNAAVANLSIPLAAIQQISFPTGVPDGGAYANGASFTFLAVGDPAEDADAGGRFNTKKFHYLAFPNNPPISVYKP